MGEKSDRILMGKLGYEPSQPCIIFHVVGLSRSLISVGVPSVVVSLRSVPDTPTAELMVEFYRQLDQGQDKGQALCQAMLATMEKYSHPRN